MASLEPPVPATAARGFDTPLVLPDDSSVEELAFSRWRGKHGLWARWRRIVGLLLLFLTVFLWTVSNFLASVSWLFRILAVEGFCYLGPRETDTDWCFLWNRRFSRITLTANPTSSLTSIPLSSLSRSYLSSYTRSETIPTRLPHSARNAPRNSGINTRQYGVYSEPHPTTEMRADRTTTKTT